MSDAADALAAAGRRLAERGLVVGSSGNLSVRDGDTVAVTASGSRLDRLGPDDVVTIDLAGTVVAGTAAPTSEVPLHLAVYRATGAGAIAHTHAVASTAVSCTCDVLPPLHYTCVLVGGPVRVAPYATYGTPELADAVTAALEDRTAVLMANHGSLAIGDDLDEAVERLEIVEWLCELFLAARDGDPRILSNEELDGVAERMAAGAGESG